MSQEQYNEIQNRTQLSMVQAQSKVLQSKISILQRVLSNSERSVQQLLSENSNLNHENAEVSALNQKLKSDIIRLETEAKNSIRRDLADNL